MFKKLNSFVEKCNIMLMHNMDSEEVDQWKQLVSLLQKVY